MRKPAVRERRLCGVTSCALETHAHGYCLLHYVRWRRHGDPLAHPKRQHEACTVTGCGRRHVAHGLCWPHYQRRRRGTPLDAPVREVRCA